MLIVRREDVIAITIIISCATLTYFRILSPDQFLYVVGVIISFYFGRTYQTYVIYRGLKRILGNRITYQRMVRRFGSFLLISGITLLIEKYIMSGASLTYPPILDHALWGLILTIIGWVLLIRKEGQKS